MKVWQSFHEQDLRVSAIVKGKRSVINEMKKTGLTATVDVADASEGKTAVR